MLVRPLPVALIALAAVCTVPRAQAEAVDYDFTDPKGVNGIVFLNDSPLEPFVGFGREVSGVVSFDPANPEGFGGSIQVRADSLEVTNEQMTEYMLSEGWLGAGEGAAFEAVFDSVEEAVSTDAGASVLTVKGRLKYGLFEIEKTYRIEATLVRGGAADRGPKNKEGDLLVLRCDFTVDRTDFGLKPEMDFSVVAQQIQVLVRIAGYQASAM